MNKLLSLLAVKFILANDLSTGTLTSSPMLYFMNTAENAVDDDLTLGMNTSFGD